MAVRLTPDPTRSFGTSFAVPTTMAVSKQVSSYAGKKLMRRLTRSIPWVGGIIALVTLGSAIRRKGLVGGACHTALDAIPYVGGAKNVAEIARGRDFFPDRVRAL